MNKLFRWFLHFIWLHCKWSSQFPFPLKKAAFWWCLSSTELNCGLQSSNGCKQVKDVFFLKNFEIQEKNYRMKVILLNFLKLLHCLFVTFQELLQWMGCCTSWEATTVRAILYLWSITIPELMLGLCCQRQWALDARTLAWLSSTN